MIQHSGQKMARRRKKPRYQKMEALILEDGRVHSIPMHALSSFSILYFIIIKLAVKDLVNEPITC